MRVIRDSISLWIFMLALALGCAYWASLPRDENGKNISALKVNPADVTQIELDSPAGKIIASRQEQKNDRWWFTIEPNQNHSDGETSQPRTIDHFLASDRFRDYLEKVSKFDAQREIGAIAEPELKNFGFNEQAGKLTLKTTAGQILGEFKIGKQLYGARVTYVMRKPDNKVFLVSSDMVDDFSKPEARFFERKIMDVRLESLRSIRLESSDKSKSFFKTKKEENGVAQWALESISGPVITGAGLWIERFTELKAASYVPQNLREDVVRLKPILTVTLEDSDGNSAKVTMVHNVMGQKSEFYVYTDYLGWPVKVASARAENLIKDLPQLLKE